ncbi:threonine synthase [Paenibacillus sp. HJL G12]|uniref:Threonine synthase n=1 Tax=Paenibacillus dendrobii TaxID=2691084 RepID=A0A7X3LIQ7_9BACL|nr:threonine synthase [Paenibacillus dendrobii]MWV46402.1 threonine synthase [Paenibacillus dendrobii]
MKLVCVDCSAELSWRESHTACSCGGRLEVIQDLKMLDGERLKTVFQERLAERMSVYASGVWRYKELILPGVPEEHIVTKYEGNTGLYTSEPIRSQLGIRALYFKAQSENPSGSFKDNGMTAAVSHGRFLGYKHFACTSTGNTSSSLAMYAAWGGCSSQVFVPSRSVSVNKVLQTLAYGAKVIRFDGTYDDGIRFLEQHGEELGLYVCNSVNPFRIEGQKSIIYEIAQYLNWELPDWIVIPGGALSNVSALGKGLEDLKNLGMITKLPRIALIQAEGASPFHRMMADGQDELIPQPNPATKASALNIGNPPSWKIARRVLRQCQGITCSVNDEEIMVSKKMIDQSGIGCEPASAATLAGLRKLMDDRIIDKDERALCILTGNLLKDTDILAETTDDMVYSDLTIESLRDL